MNPNERSNARGRAIGFALIAAILAGPAAAQTSADIGAILQRLDRLEQQNRELAAEVRALRQELAAAHTAPAQAPTVEERLDVQDARIAEQQQTKVEASQRFPIRVTGMALFNTFLNSQFGGGAEYPAFAAASPSEVAGGASFRQTILGFEYHGPQTVAGGKIRGELQMDLFGGSGKALDQLLRVRTASIGIDWKTRSVEVGLEKPLFSPRDPTSLAQVAVSPLTGAGNLWLWIPQVRFQQTLRFGRQTGLVAQGAVVQTHESTSDVPSPYGADQGLKSDLEASRPGLEGRFEFFTGGEERRLEIAPGFHHSVTHVADGSVPSNLVSLDWLLRPMRRIEVTGAFFDGQNVTNLGTGGIRQGFVVLAPGLVRPVHSIGGWSQLALNATERLSFHLFSGQQDDRNTDLAAGRVGKNLAFGANLYYRLAPNVIVSVETSQFRTTYIGAGTPKNNHYDLALAYLF